jgi:type II secretory pathway component PulC
MKQPLWIVNSSLLLLFIVVGMFIVFSRSKVPTRVSIIPEQAAVEFRTERPIISSKKIYEKDLFGTYIVVPAVKPADINLEMPPAPIARPPIIPALPVPVFLPPLNVTLKGIVTVAYDDMKNRAIIADNKTNQEGVYKVGDSIEDAHLMRIFTNKVVLVRSNGQQEVLYLREKDAKIDPMFASLSGWVDIVREIHPNEYSVDPNSFTDRIKSLAQFIDMFDLTTVYKKGQNVGCRVGTIAKDSLGSFLGFQSGDIILKINNIPATDTAHRLKIYKDIVQTPLEGKQITVEFMRRRMIMTVKITLEEKKPKPTFENIQMVPAIPKTGEEIKDKELRTLKEKYNFAPTIKEIREKERAHMVQREKRNNPSIIE